jgi:hypothetical protein
VARSAKVGTGFASDRATNYELARDLIAKPSTLSRITRVARKPHLHWVSAGRVDFPQPAAAVTDGWAGLRQMWEQAFQNGRGNFTNSCVRREPALAAPPAAVSPVAPERGSSRAYPIGMA